MIGQALSDAAKMAVVVMYNRDASSFCEATKMHGRQEQTQPCRPGYVPAAVVAYVLRAYLYRQRTSSLYSDTELVLCVMVNK